MPPGQLSTIGELDLATAPQLREVLIDLAALGRLRVTWDLSELAFIDSSGLTVLVTGLKRLQEEGGALALRSPNAAAMKVFDITGLTNIFAIGLEFGRRVAIVDVVVGPSANGARERRHTGGPLGSSRLSTATRPGPGALRGSGSSHAGRRSTKIENEQLAYCCTIAKK